VRTGRQATLAMMGDIDVALRRHVIWLVLAALVLVLALALEAFWTLPNLLNILRQFGIVGLLAIGITPVLIAGHFDLSVGAILTLAAVVAIEMQPIDTASTLAAIAVPLLLGLLIGAANGLLVGGLGANSIIVTIAMQFVLGGATLLLVGGQHVRVDNAAATFVAIDDGKFLGVPIPVCLLVAVAAAGQFLLRRTLFGRHVRAVGGNPATAALVGIAVSRCILAVFAMSGALAALAGILLASRVRNLDPTAGAGYELEALTAAVLGGTRLMGGHGDVLQTLAGVMILGVVANAMRLLDLSYDLQLLLQGLVLIVAVAINYRSRTEVR
jgi:ribose transport system permease protein